MMRHVMRALSARFRSARLAQFSSTQLSRFRSALIGSAALLSVALGLTAASCAGDDTSPWAQFGAFFQFRPVTAAPKTLLPALGNPGEWCYVTIEGQLYTFKSATTGRTDTYPKTQLSQYGTTVWIAGLLVGTPTVPEIGGTTLAPMAFDLACPACHTLDGVRRSVSMTNAALGRATCSRCHRVYDLHAGGIVVDGAAKDEPNPRLYRYRCSYANDAFVVHN